MRTYFNITLVSLILCLSGTAVSQNYLQKTLTGQYSPDQLVSLSATLPFDQAVDLISKVSENAKGRKIVSAVDYNLPIGIEIINMYYEKALDIIVRLAGFVYETKNDLIVIKKSDQPVETPKSADTYASVDSREVKISAVFFQSDVDKARQMGINWQFLLSKNGLDVGANLGSLPTGTSNLGQLNLKSSFDAGGFFGEATAIFQFFESENVGEVIARPITTVRDGKQGNIQVGSDFSVKEKDFSGNTVEKFYPTGTILNVTPHVYTEDGINYIVLNISAEKSTFSVSEQTSVIQKTSATTQVVILDGEETMIGGLFSNEEQTERIGIPILKDLPWWFFGLRYIFGSDKVTYTKKELVILIKADLVPTLKERLAGQQPVNKLKEELLKNRERMKYYNFNRSTTEENK